LSFQLTGDPRNFGVVYANPQSSNIHRRINISIALKTTMSTPKQLTRSIRLALDGMYMVTSRTGLGRVGGWNKNNRNTCNIGFVFNKQPQLVKSPIVSPASFCFRTWFLVKRFPDIGQVLKCQSAITLFGLSNQLFRDIVIQPLLKALFSPRKPSQQFTRTASAFGLNIRLVRNINLGKEKW